MNRPPSSVCEHLHLVIDGFSGATNVWAPPLWTNPPHQRGGAGEGAPAECLEWVLYEKTLLNEDLGEAFLGPTAAQLCCPPPTSTSPNSDLQQGAQQQRLSSCSLTQIIPDVLMQIYREKRGKNCISKQNCRN